MKLYLNDEGHMQQYGNISINVFLNICQQKRHGRTVVVALTSKYDIIQFSTIVVYRLCKQIMSVRRSINNDNISCIQYIIIAKGN